MRCPYCGHSDQRVLDSRPARDGEAIRRRRECVGCGRRYTTFEAPEPQRLFVVKRSGERQEFDRDKVLRSLLIACRKRPVSADRLQKAADHVERRLLATLASEVPSAEVGEMVLAELAGLDEVAFVRFASVYREFESLDEFTALIAQLRRERSTKSTLTLTGPVDIR